MQTVIHYYIDTFNVTEMNTFLDNVYGLLIGKQVNEDDDFRKEVDDSVDDDHLRYIIQKIRQEREQERLERERQEQERREQERLEQERLEQERLEQEQGEQERLEQERLEQEQGNKMVRTNKRQSSTERYTEI